MARERYDTIRLPQSAHVTSRTGADLMGNAWISPVLVVRTTLTESSGSLMTPRSYNSPVGWPAYQMMLFL